MGNTKFDLIQIRHLIILIAYSIFQIISKDLDMGCCSGGSDDVHDCSDAQESRGSNSSAQIKPKINLDNYTYFPGTIRQTDYTNSQIRTGWASEMDRKRNISKTIYYSPSYVVLGHHGHNRSPRNSGESSISKYISRNPIERKKKG